MKTIIKHIANIRTGVFAKPVDKGDIVYLQAKYFDEAGVLKTELEPDLNAGSISSKHLLEQGDVLFAAKGSKNFAATFNHNGIPAVASTSFFVIRVHQQQVLPAFLTWFLNTPGTQQLLKRYAKGSSIVSISKDDLSELEISIPSIEKQHLILKTANLRKLELSINNQISDLKEQYIQALLKSALKK